MAGYDEAIGFLEVSSIARGIEATDAMLKMASVELLMTLSIPRGKHLIMIGGTVADVEAGMRAGVTTADGVVLDSFIIQNVHPQLPPAIKGRVKVAMPRSRPRTWNLSRPVTSRVGRGWSLSPETSVPCDRPLLPQSRQ